MRKKRKALGSRMWLCYLVFWTLAMRCEVQIARFWLPRAKNFPAPSVLRSQ